MAVAIVILVLAVLAEIDALSALAWRQSEGSAGVLVGITGALLVLAALNPAGTLIRFIVALDVDALLQGSEPGTRPAIAEQPEPGNDGG